jgi:transposase InsO family protein
MDELRELYYNSKTGLISAYKLYVKLNKTIPLKTIEAFINQQESYQIKKHVKSHQGYKPITVYSSNDQWQIDLIDFSKYSRWNSGFKFLLCVVDVFSRKGFVAALKSKSETTQAMKNILAKQKPILIQSDNGTEFLNKSFQGLLKSVNVRHITVDVGNHRRQGIVERFNKTIENLISRYQESRNTNRYIEILDNLVYNYNHSYHRAINETPKNKYNMNLNSGFIKAFQFNNQIKIGDRVRILKDKMTFQKGYEPIFSKTIYIVHSGDGYTFKLQTEEGIKLKRSYKIYELQKLTSSVKYQHDVSIREKPLTHKQNKNKREIAELEEHTLQPSHKKRKVFTGNYFV